MVEEQDTTEELEQVQRIIDQAEEIAKREIRTQLSNGVEIEIVQVPSELMRRAMQAIQKPPIPKVTFERSGEQITEENPDDPDYLDALDDYHRRRMDVFSMVLLARGTRLVHVPEGMYRPEDDAWIEEVRDVGVEPDVSTKARRYAEWLRLYAFVSQADHANVTAMAMMRYGILDREVSETIEFFRHKAQRGIAADAPVESDDTDGN